MASMRGLLPCGPAGTVGASVAVSPIRRRPRVARFAEREADAASPTAALTSLTDHEQQVRTRETQNTAGTQAAFRSMLDQRTLDRNAFVRSCCGLASMSRGGPDSTTTPASMNVSLSPTSRAKPISWVTTRSEERRVGNESRY